MITRSSVRRKSKMVFQKVIELRKKGHSYTEIKDETGVAKSTINNWLTFAGLTLSKEHLEIQNKKRIENHVLGTLASKVTRSKNKAQDINNFIQKYKQNIDDPLFVAGIMLYEAEGSKGDNNCFSNSDFRLIRTYIMFLEKFFNIGNTNLSYRIYIHETRMPDLQRIIKFWSKKLEISDKLIKISWKHNIVTNKRVNLNYVGQMSIRVNKQSHFTKKILTISDIILSRYYNAESSNGRTLGFGPRDF